MNKNSIERVLIGLNEAEVRYMVVGGLAVIAHGYVRATKDIDLVFAMDDQNLLKASSVLEDIGYKPLVPINLKDIANPQNRKDWIENKNALALNLVGRGVDDIRVDIMLHTPFEIEDELSRVVRYNLVNVVNVPIASIDALIQMKTGTGRPKDMDDLLQLQRIKRLEQDKQYE